LGDRFVTVRNGADSDPLPQPRPTGRFTIAFAGSIYAGRDPRTLFGAIARVVHELELGPHDLSVEFMGDEVFDTGSLTSLAASAGIGSFFRAHGWYPRAHTLEFLSTATLLVSLPQHLPQSIPGKIYEYVRFSAWLLILAERHSASANLLRGSGADVVDPEDIDAITSVIRQRYEDFRKGTHPTPVNWDGRFDRTAPARLMFQHLDLATRPRPR